MMDRNPHRDAPGEVAYGSAATGSDPTAEIAEDAASEVEAAMLVAMAPESTIRRLSRQWPPEPFGQELYYG